MFFVKFEIMDSLNHTQYFEKIFFIANISQPVILGIPFLKLGNPDVSRKARTIQ